MNKQERQIMNAKITAIFLSSTLLLSSCAGHRHPYYGHGRVPVGLQISFIARTPPPPRRVVIPPRPVVDAIWIDGYWNWTGIRFVWVDGYWERNPPPGKTWQSHRWIHTERGWYQRPGRWR